MAQNQAHMGDIVSIATGELAGMHGIITALRLNDNRCVVSISDTNGVPPDHTDYQYDGTELKLIMCYHMGIITGE